MSKRVLVSVTQEDIEAARAMPRDSFRCETCPVACAIKRRLRLDDPYPKVSTFDATLDFRLTSIDLPESARRFIRAFDDDQPVKPFRFYLTVPETRA